jgi:hypothetical protein
MVSGSKQMVLGSGQREGKRIPVFLYFCGRHCIGGLILMVKIIRVRALLALLCLVVWVGCRVQKYPPELTQALPNRSPIGQEITLTGYQFSDKPTVTFGKDGIVFPAEVKEANDQTIKVTVPRMPIGLAMVQVANEQGITDPVAFSVLQPLPVVNNVTPGNALPGQNVVITGDYLDQLVWVRFGPGGVNTFVANTPQSITVTVPVVPRGPQNLQEESLTARI